MEASQEEKEVMNEDEEKETKTERQVADEAIGEIGWWQGPSVFLCSCVILSVVCSIQAIVFLGPPVIFNCTNGNGTCYTANSTPCTSWEYDRSIFTETIVTEWDLVCDQRQLVSWVQTSFLFGVMLGSIFIGMISDRIGRKIPLIVNGIVQGATGLAAGLSPWFWGFIGFRFIQAIAFGGSLTVANVLCVELIGPRTRSRIGTLIHLSVYIGTSVAALIAYLTRDWRGFELATTLPCFATILFYWIVPESPRWLLAAGKRKRAMQLLKQAAKRNGNPVPTHLPLAPATAKDYEKERKPNIWDLMKTPRIRKHTLVMCVNFIATGFSFYGLTQYISHLSGNIFLNVAISGACGTPGVFLAVYIMSTIGRKTSQFVGQAISACSCLAIVLIPDEMELLRVIAAIFGVVGTGVSFPSEYLYMSELAPTVVRNTAVGSGAVSARIGAMVAPFAVAMNATSAKIPPLMFGIASLIAASLCFFLPETLNASLPITLEDGENFTGSQVHCCSCIRRKDKDEPKAEKV